MIEKIAFTNYKVFKEREEMTVGSSNDTGEKQQWKAPKSYFNWLMALDKD
ncbi:MAG: hypothetical protein ACI3ZD_10030 [Prevotella sp.]